MEACSLLKQMEDLEDIELCSLVKEMCSNESRPLHQAFDDAWVVYRENTLRELVKRMCRHGANPTSLLNKIVCGILHGGSGTDVWRWELYAALAYLIDHAGAVLRPGIVRRFFRRGRCEWFNTLQQDLYRIEGAAILIDFFGPRGLLPRDQCEKFRGLGPPIPAEALDVGYRRARFWSRDFRRRILKGMSGWLDANF